MRLLALLTMALLAAPVSADEFHFGKDRVIHGVLLSEADGMYKIRIEGGKIEVPVKSVVKRVADNLTVETIKQREDAKREALAQANVERQKRQAEWREKMRQRRIAAAQRAALIRASRCNPVYYVPGRRTYRYDPTLGTSRVIVRERGPGLRNRVRTFSIRPRR